MGIRSEIRRISQTRPLLDVRAEFESVDHVSDGYLRVTLRGDGLAAYDDARPADAFKLMLPPDGSKDVDGPRRGDDGLPIWPDEARRPVLRAFTVREFDCDRQRLTFDVLIHAGHTLGWLRDATPGDPVGLAGMRVDYVDIEHVDHRVFVADASAAPAVAAILDSLPPGTTATAIVGVDSRDDRRIVRDHRGVDLRWVEGGSPVGDDNPLVAAARALPRPDGRTQAWICAEATTTRAIRAHALQEWGVDREDLHAAAYWKAGLDSTANDAVALARYREVMAAGGDPASPDVRERVEFDLTDA